MPIKKPKILSKYQISLSSMYMLMLIAMDRLLKLATMELMPSDMITEFRVIFLRQIEFDNA